MGSRRTQPLATPGVYGKEIKVNVAPIQSHSLKTVCFFKKHKHHANNTFKNEMSYTSSIEGFNIMMIPNGNI